MRGLREGICLRPAEDVWKGHKEAPAHITLQKEKVTDGRGTYMCRLESAGAVLVAKLATGEMAFDDVWWGGKVKNPWNIAEGSSGSSAGPAAAVVAGCVVFAVRPLADGTACSAAPYKAAA
jgi:Asp-tRNA(Asn)/Glu-tRNA(Gln) amidotransferase A subunit family amidase